MAVSRRIVLSVPIPERPRHVDKSAANSTFRDVVKLLHESPEEIVPLEITQREANGIYVLSLDGRLVLGKESSGFRSTIENLLSSGAKKIVINLEHANYIDSAGLGSLIEAHRTTKAKGGRVALCSLGKNFKQALEYARLLPVFETFPTEAAAVESFGA
jgi:anti-sigma B factor antagonist